MTTRQPPTLTRHLLAWALGALTLVWAAFIGFGWRTGAHEADELTDGHLASVSSLLLPLAPGGIEPDALPTPADASPEGKDLRAHDYQRSLTVVVWDAQGHVLSHTGDAPVPPFTVPDGFATLQLGSPAQGWRTFSRWDRPHAFKLTVMLSAQERDELAADIAQQVVEPGLWLLPAVALVLGLAIHRGMRPLRRLAQEVHALDTHNGQKVQAPVRFREFDAAVDAINFLELWTCKSGNNSSNFCDPRVDALLKQSLTATPASKAAILTIQAAALASKAVPVINLGWNDAVLAVKNGWSFSNLHAFTPWSLWLNDLNS